MSRARDLSNDQANTGGSIAPYVAGKNVLINGNFDIWQRGTSGFTTNNIYTADRWFVYSQTNYSLSQETSVIPSNSTYAAKITITGANGFCNLANTLEQIEVERLAGQTITFSVNLRANSTYNGSTAVQINYSTTGNSQLATWTNLIGTTVTPSTSAYTRVSVTATIPTNAKGLQFYVGQNSVLANGSIYYIAQAQAELGSIATPFSRAGGSIGGELALCQRYYVRYLVADGYAPINSYGVGYATSAIQLTFSPPVTMRTNISQLEASGLVFQDVASGANINAGSAVINRASDKSAHILFTGMSGITAYRQYTFYGNGNSAAYFALGAEL